MKRTPHPLYLPDLTPTYFCIFGHTKQIMVGQSFSSAEKLLSAIGAILDGIEKPY
jgi:hypothetical protein